MARRISLPALYGHYKQSHMLFQSKKYHPMGGTSAHGQLNPDTVVPGFEIPG